MAAGNGIRDEIKEQRKSLKGKGIRAHLDYFFYYYKIHTIAAIIVIIFAVWFIHDAMNSSDVSFYAVAINSGISQFDDSFTDEVSAYLGLDGDNYSCNIDNSLTFDNENMNANLAVQQRIITLSAANSLDALLSDRDTFLYYASSGLFADLTDYFTKDELESLSDRIFYIDSSQLENRSDTDSEISYNDIPYEEMGNPVPVGIICPDSSFLKKVGAYSSSEAIVGICYTSHHSDYAKKFIEFLIK